jgi:lipopolysaccharide heptosyltransferase I
LGDRRLKKVLIIKPSSLGDIIHALPVASGLKASLPDVEIDWVVGVGFEEILEGNPAINRIIKFDRAVLKKAGKLNLMKSFMADLRQDSYDVVIDLQGLLRSGFMAFLSRTERRLGFENAREGASFFYNEKIAVPNPGMHAVGRYLLALDHLGIKLRHDPDFHITVTEDHRFRADALLRELGVEDGEGFIAVAPSARWKTKRWPAANFVELSHRLYAEHKIKSIYVGSEGDASILSHVKGRKSVAISEAFGKTSLKVLASLLTRSKMLVTNDSGPMHLAAAVGTPVTAIFGPTSPDRTGPYGKASGTVIKSREVCAPCFKRDCETMNCMNGVTVEQVYKTVVDAISLDRR